MIRFSCPGCGAVFSVSDDKAGKTGNCPKCQTKFQIPAAEAPAPAPPPPPPSNPFADLGEDAPKKKKPASKADLDDDLPKRKKPASKADLDDDEDDRPKKKPARRDEDDEDDAPKKKPVRAAVDDEDDRPKKKPARRDEDDEDDRPKKKPVRAAADDDYDDEDDRPRKKSKGRRDDEDDYDDRPRRKPKKSGLLLTAAILHIIAAVLYLPCGGLGLAGSGVAGGFVGAADAASRNSRDQARFNGNKFEADAVDKAITNASTIVTLLQVMFGSLLIGSLVAIPASVAGFMKKKWFVPVTLAAGGLLILAAVLFLALAFGFLPVFPVTGALLFAVLPLALGVTVVIAATNKNVKRVLT